MLLLGTVGHSPPAARAAGTCAGPPLLFDNLFAYETNFADNISSVGSELTFVGTVSGFCWPFPDLDANDPYAEYTLHLSGAQSQGTVVQDLGLYTSYTTTYWSGTLEIFRGVPRDAPAPGAMPANPPNATVPSAFMDGVQFLSGPLSPFEFYDGVSSQTVTCQITVYLSNTDNTYVAVFEARWDFGSGEALCRVEGGAPARLTAIWQGVQGDFPAGYRARPRDARINLAPIGGSPQVAVSPSCGRVGTVFNQGGTGFIGNSTVELHFVKPDGQEYPPPYVTRPVDFCGDYTHLYNSSTASQFGTYSYYAIGQQTGVQSGTVQYQILPLALPEPPTGLVVTNTGTGTSLDLSWTASTTAGVFRYEVYRWPVGGQVSYVGSSFTTSLTDPGPLTRGQQYVYAVSSMDCAGEGLLSGGAMGTPDYFPVLLVHGIFGSPEGFTDCDLSDEVDWQVVCSTEGDKLGDRLAREGLLAFVARYDNTARLATQVPRLKAVIDPVLSWAGQNKLIIVAHSQGGLISRSLLQLEPEYRAKVAKLVMLGTPNHGASLGRLALLPGFQSIGEAGIDMNPASDFLNDLNYQDDPERRDHGWSPDCGTHNPEDLAGSTEHWLLAGTGGQCRLPYHVLGCTNDGIVPIASAVLAALPPGRNILDSDLLGAGNGPLAKHYDGGIGIGLLCGEPKGLLTHDAIATAVTEIIKTSSVTVAVPDSRPALARAGGTTTEDDSMVPIAWAAGSLAPQVMVVDSALVDATQELVVVQFGEAPIDLLLRAPSGRTIVPADSTLVDVDYDASATGLTRALLVTAPETGMWAIESSNPGATSTAYRIEALLGSSIPLRLDVRDSIGVEDRRTVLAAFGSFDQPSPNGYVTCSVMRPDSVREELQLYDDGAHADGTAGDGIFGGTYLPTQPGFHFVEATGVLPGNGGGPDIHRAAWGEFVLETFKDLSVDAVDIELTRPFPPAGDSLLVSVVVRNEGVESAPAARVRLASKGAAPGPAILVAVPAGEEATAQGYWVPANQSEDTLVVTVDANYAFTESRSDNNSAQVAVSPGVVSVGEALPGLEFGVRAYPNPARGMVTFRASVPTRAHATLTLYDVAGRAVTTLHEGVLEPGPHAFEWRRVSDRGEALHSGVYFYELRAGSQRSTRRIVILR